MCVCTCVYVYVCVRVCVHVCVCALHWKMYIYEFLFPATLQIVQQAVR